MSVSKQPWYMNAVFYEVHIRAYRDLNADGKGDLPGLIEKLDYIKDLGVDCVWILPIYPSPLMTTAMTSQIITMFIRIMEPLKTSNALSSKPSTRLKSNRRPCPEPHI